MYLLLVDNDAVVFVGNFDTTRRINEAVAIIGSFVAASIIDFIGNTFVDNDAITDKLFTRFSVGVNAVLGPFCCYFCYFCEFLLV